MNEQEVNEFLQSLEEQGWEPQMCDTPVPFYENAVMCGTPTDIGDLICGMEMYPKEFFDNENEFMTIVKGDSMKDADIVEGDKVKVHATKTFQDGDILLLLIDGEYTLKSFCRDDDGNPWLVPQNAAYDAFSLLETQDIRVCGVVVEVIKRHPRSSYRSCMKKINSAKQKQVKTKEKYVISEERISEAIRQIAPMIKSKRQWYAVFRVMADLSIVEDDDYDRFIEIVTAVVPNHQALPTRAELLRIAVAAFTKPVNKWNEHNAPVRGKRYSDYLKIAQRTRTLLES